MELINTLLAPGNINLASTIVLYSFVIALGVFLGKIKFGGVSLGVTFVLFVGILMGHLGYIVEESVLKFVREFGLILFIFSIGLQVGPGFFSSFKKGGVRLNALAVLVIALNVLIVLAIYGIEGGNTSISALVGVMSGAVTNTPGLAAAQQTVANNADAANTMAMGYAAAYPLGVVGIILAMFIIKWIFHIRVEDEVKQIEQEREESTLQPHIVSFEVTNKLVDGQSLVELHRIINCNFVVSRLMTTSGEVIIPTSTTTIHPGDKLYVVMSPADEDKFKAVLGPEIEMDWNALTVQGATPVVSRRILITKSEFNGVPLGSLRLHNGYRLNCTRVNRAGVDLLASAELRLQMGDRVTVVGDLQDIERLASRMGNSMKRLNQPNIITIF
ncbi:MAG: transporter, partial [Muribaculaceae bacterium]|nr:transporter [Muribaculaceae bacterium]